jgi:hypothetical protein
MIFDLHMFTDVIETDFLVFGRHDETDLDLTKFALYCL